ncbi:MAG: hypothetical protein M1814_003122 [Vezdaea aestivalis]|nr:MAG: hypothetical protein M1814_003122 [Vezdaea aestivalis]
MVAINYTALRESTLKSTNEEEAVTVNTRALIDKVLARYSGEWTVLRELLQNAADASATKVTINFETRASPSVPVPAQKDPSSLLKHAVQHHTLDRLLVTNNGQAFQESDWARLKRIAEGNPDETKIGAFGVGFYSVFADCEDPFVQSGPEAMAFYWKGNSLFTRRSRLPAHQVSSDTCFVLDYRAKTHPIPNLIGLCQFLATSLTFVGLECIELRLDEWNILTLTKKRAPSTNLTISNTIETRTRDGTFTIQRVEKENVQIDAHYMKIVSWKPSSLLSLGLITSVFSGNDRSKESNSGAIRSWFTRLTATPPDLHGKKSQEIFTGAETPPSVEDLTALSRSTVFLGISTAHLKTRLSTGFSKELERATKKPPPKSTTLAVLTSSYGETIASESSNPDEADIFANVLPSKSGRIFIGFPTHQTTGALAHVAAHSIIPTVERESIDLNARWVRTWNVELLRAAGIVCRLIWSSSMNEIHRVLQNRLQSVDRSKKRSEIINEMLPQAIHVFRQFTFAESTPLSEVSSIIEETFWTCGKTATIEVFSTQGVLQSSDVRVSTEDLSFVEGITVLQDGLVNEAKAFVDKLREFSLIVPVTISDVQNSLGANTLDEKQLGDFLKWTSAKALRGEIGKITITNLFGAAIVQYSPTGNDQQFRLLTLGGIKNFVLPQRIPLDLPLPQTTIPFRFTKNLSQNELKVLGWDELLLFPWLRFLLAVDQSNDLPATQQLAESASFATKVLPIASKQWDSLSGSTRSEIRALFASKTIIPTKMGMKIPRETYFPSVKVFQDLPVVFGLNGVKEKFLSELGVRKTIELNVIFDRLLSDQSRDSNSDSKEGKWSHVDLIKYLSSVSQDIPYVDTQKLKDTPICPAEVKGERGNELHKVSTLYEPNDLHRGLNLPILFWPTVLRNGSTESKFLKSLGLQSHPKAEVVISILSQSFHSGDLAMRDRALNYFVDKYDSNSYSSYNMSGETKAFLPLEDDKTAAASPSKCFTNEGALSLGFHVLRKDLHRYAHKLGVEPHPPMSACFDRLVARPPQNRKEVRDQLGYLAQRVGSINTIMATKFGNAKFVPVPPKVRSSEKYSDDPPRQLRWISPRSCYMGDGDVWRSAFDFVDFGEDINIFLLKCGAKHEPTKVEIAQLLVSEPRKLLDQFNSIDTYLGVLRTLADSAPILKKDKTLWKNMQKSEFLLAYQEVKSEKRGGERNFKSSDKIYLDSDSEDEMTDEKTHVVKEYSLVTAKQTVVVDDVVSFNVFREHILVCPQEENLENLYLSIGASLLSQLVQEETRIGHQAQDQRPAFMVRKLVLERSQLFLHDQPKDTVKYNVAWLEKSMAVKNVQSVKLRRMLKGKNFQSIETRSAAMNYGKDGWTLYIVYPGLDWFHVSQAVINLLLHRPKPLLAIILEKLLDTDLLKLRAQGYNVDRILRAKAAESRLVETARRQKAEETERERLEQRQRQLEAGPDSPISISTPTKPGSQQSNGGPKMPGAFESPKHSPPPYEDGYSDPTDSSQALTQNPTSQKGRSLLSSLTRGRFGRDGSSNSITSFEGNQPREPQTHATTAADLSKTLSQAMKMTRPHGSNSLQNRPSTADIHEQATYCDVASSQDLVHLGYMAYSNSPDEGMQVYASRTMPNIQAFMKTSRDPLRVFATLLVACARVYGIPPSNVHIFVDAAGSTIAFNSGGSIFANFRYYEQLHGDAAGDGDRSKAFIYWWVVMAHELAHGLVEEHGSRHSFYTESMVTEYFAGAMESAAKWAKGSVL